MAERVPRLNNINRSVQVSVVGFEQVVDFAVSQTTPVSTRWWRVLIDAVCVALVFLVSAEATARIEDRVRHGIALLANPDRVADLVVHDALGIRGKPNGQYKHWKLNSLGFRGPEIAPQPSRGTIRIMTLGASETFGLYESSGHEYPAQLADNLRAYDRYEVVNASLFGLTLPGIHRNWSDWASRFRPDVVTIYPTPGFYLNERIPARPGNGTGSHASTQLTWRLLERAKDRIELPGFIQRRRVARGIAAIEASHDPSWFFRSVPQDRLAQFERDLDGLVRDINDAGVSVILLTHATAFGEHIGPEERAQLAAWRQLVIRPTDDVLLQFEAAAREATRNVAQRQGIPLVDVAAQLNGKKEFFADDALHFNDQGAARVAALLTTAILANGPSTSRDVQPGARPATVGR